MKLKMSWSMNHLLTSFDIFTYYFICAMLVISTEPFTMSSYVPPPWEDVCDIYVSQLDSRVTPLPFATFQSHQNHNHGGISMNRFPHHMDSISTTTSLPERVTQNAKNSMMNTNMVNVTCRIPKSDNIHWRLMDLNEWEMHNNVNAHTNPTNRTFVFALSVKCETGANISLPWPMKSIGLREIHVQNCGMVDQFALAKDPLVSLIPDELQVLVIRDSFWLVDLTARNSILTGSPGDFINIHSDYDCGQDESLQVYITSNVTLKSYASLKNVDKTNNVSEIEDHGSKSETLNGMSASKETTTMRPVRPEDRLVTDTESLISEHRGVDMASIPGFEAMAGMGEAVPENSDTNLTAKQDFLELLKKIKNTRIRCDFIKLVVRDESMSSDTPRHLLQFSTQEATHPDLTVLNYSRIGMIEFPRELREWRLYFPRLQYLDLSYNFISELYVENYPIMPDTPRTIMNIRHNNLSVLSPDILKKWAAVEKFHVDIRDNPISCDCGIKSLIPFLRDPSIFTGRMKQYEYVKYLRCQYPSSLSGRKLGSLSVDSLPCPIAESSDGLIVALVVMLATFIILTIILIRFKVEIRILLYTRLHVRLPCDSDTHRNNKLYDAFVSYSNQDSPWVIENLVKYLENEAEYLGGGVGEVVRIGEKASSNWNRQRRPFKLCLHQRDFIPGKTIVNNIIDCIEASRHTIIVLTPHFMRSHWAMEELRQAYKQSLVEKTRHLIVLLLEKVPDEELDPVIKRCVKTFTYLQVQDAIFRDKLVFSLSTKDKATRRRDRLASKSSPDCTTAPTPKTDTAAHTNYSYVSDHSEINNHNRYDVTQLPEPQYENSNEIFYPAQMNGDVSLAPANESGYYSMEIPFSVPNEYETVPSGLNGIDMTVRPSGPERVLSNSSTSSTTALTWNL